MALFYIRILNSEGLARDEEGQECADLEEARQSALKSARELVASEVRAGRNQVGFELHIVDEARARLATLPVSADVFGLN